MALIDSYVQVYGQLPDFFKKLCQGEAPAKFTVQLLKDWGYTSSNWRAVIPMLKKLGFLDSNGTPTTRYHNYRNGALSRSVMWQAVKEAYSDIFVLKSKPSDTDKPLIIGKFKSLHNASEPIAKHMANTFLALYKLAAPESPEVVAPRTENVDPESEEEKAPVERHKGHTQRPTLHYNIQIHLPPTKDLEVYNAIFRSLKEHLLE